MLVSRVPAEEMPLVDGRCSPYGWWQGRTSCTPHTVHLPRGALLTLCTVCGAGWCLVETGKDCHPAAWTWPARPCEELNATSAQRELYAQRFKPRASIDRSMVRGVAMNEA